MGKALGNTTVSWEIFLIIYRNYLSLLSRIFKWWKISDLLYSSVPGYSACPWKKQTQFYQLDTILRKSRLWVLPTANCEWKSHCDSYQRINISKIKDEASLSSLHSMHCYTLQQPRNIISVIKHTTNDLITISWKGYKLSLRFSIILIFQRKSSLTTKRATFVAIWTTMLFRVIFVTNKINLPRTFHQ